MKFQMCRRIFKKTPQTKFHKIPSSGSRVVQCGDTDGRADRHDEAKRRFSQRLRRRLCDQRELNKPFHTGKLRRLTSSRIVIIFRLHFCQKCKTCSKNHAAT